MDESIVQVVTTVTEKEEVVRVFVSKEGNSLTYSTPSKRVTRAAAAAERARTSAIKDA